MIEGVYRRSRIFFFNRAENVKPSSSQSLAQSATTSKQVYGRHPPYLRCSNRQNVNPKKREWVVKNFKDTDQVIQEQTLRGT